MRAFTSDLPAPGPVPESPIRFVNLRDAPHWLPALARLHACEWTALEQITFRQRIERLRRHLGSAPLPTTWIAKSGDALLGSVSLVSYAGLGLTGIWLANLCVAPSWRQRGLGTAMLHLAEQRAVAMGHSALQLLTSDRRDFYEKRGWQWRRRLAVQNEFMDLMQRTIAPPNRGRSSACLE